ncbi:hypothetical protein V9T40_006856 [Parthenolecanium corni]|uniref:Major facilitator superfamily (MFS) profile domain-containing protein n=1 Tax=Parthenolecanium corni TaxID=536013 RepID=A0AAN9Y9N0_9HEMI
MKSVRSSGAAKRGAQEAEKKSLQWDLDEVLTELKFGSYQLRNLVLIGLMIMFSNLYPLSFTLTAADVDYRCKIPECEDNSTKSQFKTSWTSEAIPYNRQEPYKCKRYKPLSNSTTGFNETHCSALFNSSVEEKCEPAEIIYFTDDVTIVNEFGILCENRKWELSLIGTINNLAQFIGIPLSGVLSDRYGRKFVAIMCSFLSAVFGICRGLSTNYKMFAAFEFLDAFFGSGIYGTAFILGIELVNPKMRSLAATVIGIFYPFGAVIMGCIAWYFKNWRKLLIVSYSPGLFFILYFWIIPESVRWLQMNGHHSKAMSILKKISASNNIELSEKALQQQEEVVSCLPKEEKKEPFWKPILIIFQTKLIWLRLLNCSFCWFTNTLVYYGLSINSVELVGNKYFNFVLTNAVEIPAFVLSGFILQKVSRRMSQSAAFFFSGVACLVCEFVPADMFWLQLPLFLVSKFLITVSFNIMYVYTAEMFPTELRLSLCGFASMFGRFGSMLAPQTILLKDLVGQHAPVLLFGVTSVIAGGLSTSFPETLNKKLPDTVNQAKMVDES